MRGGQVRAAAAVALVAGSVAACGGGGEAPAAKGKVVHGETETGMKLEVETFVDPASDPELKKLDAWRSARHYPAVDYHRITADNTKGQMPDRDRTISFAKSADAIATGQGVEGRFACDALRYEWLPVNGAGSATYEGLRKQLCPVAPDTPDAIAPGKRAVYYLVTDRGFAERGLDRLRIFGPRSAELHSRARLATDEERPAEASRSSLLGRGGRSWRPPRSGMRARASWWTG